MVHGWNQLKIGEVAGGIKPLDPTTRVVYLEDKDSWVL
jgi:hypothetical protein